jgi:hypothetical protein
MTTAPLAAALALAVDEFVERLQETRDAGERAYVVAVQQSPRGLVDLALGAALEDLAVVQRRIAGAVGDAEPRDHVLKPKESVA